MSKTITEYVINCPTCIRMKASRRRPQGLLQPLPVPSIPWSDIAMDFIVELPKSATYDTIMVVVDRFTKMAHFIPLVGLPTAAETASVFIREVFRLHGLPSTITTDRGTQFTARFWRAFCKGLHITQALTSAYHPQANGQTERTNGILEQYLRCYISYLQHDWSSYLPLAEFNYNNQVQRSTTMTPFFINSGYHPSMLPGSPLETNVPKADERLSNIHRNYRLVRAELLKAQRRFKFYADRHRRPAPVYHVGDKVWLSSANVKLSCPSRKLGPCFLGPFFIEKVLSPVVVKLRLPPTLRIHPVFHVSLLKAVTPDPFPSRVLTTPGPVSTVADDEYEVELILDSRWHRRNLEYLIRWKGYGAEDDSWVSYREVR
uniref:Uncharacterized protein n=1 Tax=Leptobrachium leishanense TaxID=445787 RepID=A0A8C5MP91_9ANUR